MSTPLILNLSTSIHGFQCFEPDLVFDQTDVSEPEGKYDVIITEPGPETVDLRTFV